MKPAPGVIGNVIGPTELVDMAMAYSRSRVLCAAARLGLADALADGEHAVEELANLCGADTTSLHRLLRALASIGVTAETAPGVFVLTPFGSPLRKDAPNSQWAAIVFWSDLLADSWSYLTECVRTGDTAARIMESQGIASRWSKDPDADSIFRAVMGTAPAEDYMPIVRSWDFAHSHVVADLGGGGGALLAAILKSHSHLTGMLVDRESSIGTAIQRFETDSLMDRCRLVSADLTESVSAGADVYLIKHVLHGYRDNVAGAILKNCRAVIPPTGHLLVIEFVLPDIIPQSDPSVEGRLMSDLNMMAVTGGRERSAKEWATLLHNAGFQLQRIIPVLTETGSVQSVSVVEATPVSSQP